MAQDRMSSVSLIVYEERKKILMDLSSNEDKMFQRQTYSCFFSILFISLMWLVRLKWLPSVYSPPAFYIYLFEHYKLLELFAYQPLFKTEMDLSPSSPPPTPCRKA